MLDCSTAESLRDRFRVVWGDELTTSMFVEVCVFVMEDGVDIVVPVAAEDSDILLDTIDLTSSNCWLSVSVCCNISRSSVLRLVACSACVVMRLEMREFDS